MRGRGGRNRRLAGHDVSVVRREREGGARLLNVNVHPPVMHLLWRRGNSLPKQCHLGWGESSVKAHLTFKAGQGSVRSWDSFSRSE